MVGKGGAERPHSHDGHTGLGQFFLSFFTDRGKKNLSGVSLLVHFAAVPPLVFAYPYFLTEG
jgi:hypothetical protein